MSTLDKVTKYLRISLFTILSIISFLALSPAFADNANTEIADDADIDFSHSQTLRGGWYTFAPYQYQIEKNGINVLTGLDYELMNVIAKEAKLKLDYQHIPWDQLLKDLGDGKEDFATGVLYNNERAKSVYYSIPYRYAEVALFLPQGKISDLAHQSAAELLVTMKGNKFKLAVVKGFIYSDPLIDHYVHDPANSNLIVNTQNDDESLDLLLSGEVDGFLADRIVGSNLIWHANADQPIIEHRFKVKAPIYLIFSKKTVSPMLVQKINTSIHKIMKSESYENIVSWYLYPAIVFQIKNAFWFKMTELIGTVAFAISGLLIAFREKTTLFGAFILAILPSLGGGLIRDVIFGRNPVGALQSPIYLSTVLLTVLIGFFFIKLLNHYRKNNAISREVEDAITHHAAIILTVTDAMGLATFTVIGVMVSLLAKASPLWLWGPFFAFVTGAGGGILRDMLSKTRYIEALEGEFYGELAIIWGFLLSVYILLSTNQAQPEYIEYAVVITIIGVFISRLLVHFMNWTNIYFKQPKS